MEGAQAMIPAYVLNCLARLSTSLYTKKHMVMKQNRRNTHWLQYKVLITALGAEAELSHEDALLALRAAGIDLQDGGLAGVSCLLPGLQPCDAKHQDVTGLHGH